MEVPIPMKTRAEINMVKLWPNPLFDAMNETDHTHFDSVF